MSTTIGTQSGYDSQPEMTQPLRRILAVCTANRCRSPMLTAILRHRLARNGLSRQVAVSSGGLLAQDGVPVEANVFSLLESRGLPLAETVSRQVQPADIRQAHLILVATEQHRLSIFHRAPGELYKVVLLSELVGESRDLADPIGLPAIEFQRTLAEIERYVDTGWYRLLQLLAL